jgi:hypothetical protein
MLARRAACPINAPDRQSFAAPRALRLLKPAPASRLHVVDQLDTSIGRVILTLFMMLRSRVRGSLVYFRDQTWSMVAPR